MTARHPLPDPPVQVVAIAATGGTFTLTYSGQETAALAFDASPADVQAALEALGRVGAGNVAVSGPDGGPFQLRFGGALDGPRHRRRGRRRRRSSTGPSRSRPRCRRRLSERPPADRVVVAGSAGSAPPDTTTTER